MTVAGLRKLWDQTSDGTWLVLLRIDHPALDETLRVCSDKRDFNSRGQLYVSYPFALTFAGAGGDEAPTASLEIALADERLIEAARAADDTPPVVEMEIVEASAPDDPEMGPVIMELREVSWDMMIIKGTIGPEPLLNDMWPPRSFTADLVPGTFSGGEATV